MARIHGVDERLSIENLNRGITRDLRFDDRRCAPRSKQHEPLDPDRKLFNMQELKLHTDSRITLIDITEKVNRRGCRIGA